ncbi:hypothetical protein AB7W40_23145 [Providencia rettgeri]
MFNLLRRKDKKQYLDDIEDALSEINKTKERVKKSQKDVEEDIERGSRITKHRFTL